MVRGERDRSILPVELSSHGDLRREMKVHPLRRTLRKKPYHCEHHHFIPQNRMKQNPLMKLPFYHVALVFYRPVKFP